jgi:hypothetical protein
MQYLRNTLGRFPGRNRPMKPGARMAGGLVGAILGGGLGAGTRQMMIQDSPAASVSWLKHKQVNDSIRSSNVSRNFD